jgi:transcriptional regulator with XRE-family HTH domain
MNIKPKLDGNRLRRLRKLSGLSAERLGRKADVSTRHVWRLERGERSAGAEVLARLALALDTTMEYLLGIVDGDSSIFSIMKEGQEIEVEHGIEESL